MKTMTQRIAGGRRAAWLAVALTFAGAAVAEQEGTIITRPDNRPLAGMLKWRALDRVYEIKSGQTTTTWPLEKVNSVQIRTPPPALEGLSKLVKDGAGGSAIPGLLQIVASYEMLNYDLEAARWLAVAYTKGNKAAEAIRVCEQVSQYRPKSALPADFLRAYWQALLMDRQYTKLEQELADVAAEGGREAAAVAQNTRGDMKMEKKGYRDALVDGYLRTVVLFQDIKSAQPEALFKAAQCFDQLGQATYAERMRKRLLSEFPQDPNAEKLKAGG